MDTHLRRPVLSEAVRKHIKRYIIEKKLKPGDYLPPEAQLALDLGVGRSSIREAMKSLQSLGIVEVQRGEGFFVRKWNLDPVLETLRYGICFNPAAFKELIQIRVWLELATIGEAVDKITPEDLTELDAIMQAWAARCDTGTAFADLDERFHDVLYQSLENNTFTSLLHTFWRAFEIVEDDLLGEPNIREEFDAHYAIFEAITHRDKPLAKERLFASFKNLYIRLQINSPDSD